MALQPSDLLIVQRNQQSYKMAASELQSFNPQPNVGDGLITIVQPGTTDQTFTVNQAGPTTITLRNDNDDTKYTAGNGLTLTGTEFSAVAADNTVTIDGNGIKVNPGNLGLETGVTAITPGFGLRNGSTVGPTNSIPITSTGFLSIDDTVVRTSDAQTINGSKTFNDTLIAPNVDADNIFGASLSLSGSTLDLSLANSFYTTVTGGVTFSFQNPAVSGNAQAFILEIAYGTGTVAWPASVEWKGDEAPELEANTNNLFIFYTRNGGTTWYGSTLLEYIL